MSDRVAVGELTILGALSFAFVTSPILVQMHYEKQRGLYKDIRLYLLFGAYFAFCLVPWAYLLINKNPLIWYVFSHFCLFLSFFLFCFRSKSSSDDTMSQDDRDITLLYLFCFGTARAKLHRKNEWCRALIKRFYLRGARAILPQSFPRHHGKQNVVM